MNCESFMSRFSFYHDNELPTDEMSQMDTHLSKCVKCSAENANWNETMNLMKNILRYEAPVDFPQVLLAKTRTQSTSGKKLQLLRVLVSACVVVLAISLFFLMPKQNIVKTISGDAKILDNAIATEKGKSASVLLLDDSKVLMSEDTEFRVRSFRELELFKGQFVLEVAKSSENFLILTKLARIEVVGTKFFVGYDNRLLTVRVIIGQVKVQNDFESVILSSGEEATCQDGDKEIRKDDSIARLQKHLDKLSDNDPQIRDASHQEIIKIVRDHKDKAKEMVSEIQKLAKIAKDHNLVQKLTTILEQIKFGSWVHVAECPISPRDYHTAVFHNGEVLIWGGFARRKFPTDGGKFNLVKNSWTKISNSPLNGRYFHSSFVYKDKMLVCAGLANPKVKLIDGAVYDITNDSWKAMSDCPLKTRAGYLSAMYEDKLIIWGGRYPDAEYYNDGAMYDITNDKWIEIKDCPVEGRSFAQMVLFGDKFAVWGGRSPDFKYYNTCGIYDISKSAWKEAKDCPIEGRNGYTFVHCDVKLIIWGGWSGKPRNDGVIYDLTKEKWTKMKESPLKVRAGHISVVHDGKIIVWGGNDNSWGNKYLNDGAIYDVASDSWSMMDKCPINGRITSEFVKYQDKILVWGGTKGDKIFNDGAIFDISRNKWIKMSDSSLAGRECHTLTVCNDRLLVWGGCDAGGKPFNDGAIYEFPMFVDID